ncbi:MAG TPA: response regulator transcription factor [Catalimonadaceae bacterium]|jgi:two-component system copper resistance phosphate regulon response regulator CusR|nr:response regulator transcription factor [Catalimonadaceae bacterium]
MKILVVEDELNLASFLKRGLEEEGHKVEMALDGKTAKVHLATDKFDLLVLDVILPDANGVKLCQDFKSLHPKMPIILLTALGSTQDKVTGLDAGADDYLVKPFQFSELMARIRAIERRLTQTHLPTQYKALDLVLDVESRLVSRNGVPINLTTREFRLLQVFLMNKNRVLTRLEIAESVWDINFDTGTNVVDVYVNYLRNKIDKGHDTKLIHTVIGVGYVLRAD